MILPGASKAWCARTSRAEAGKLQLGSTVSFGDVPRSVDAREEDRYTLVSRPLQRRKPMADLFEARPESSREKVEVVAQFACGIRETPEGQDQRAGIIVLQANATNFIGFRSAELRISSHRINGIGSRELSNLQRDLEIARRYRQIGIEGQDLCLAIVGSNQVATVHSRNAHGVAPLQVVRQHGIAVVVTDPQFPRERLCRDIDLVDIVVDEVEEVTDFLVRSIFNLPRAAAERVINTGELFGIVAVGLVRREPRSPNSQRLRVFSEGAAPA